VILTGAALYHFTEHKKTARVIIGIGIAITVVMIFLIVLLINSQM